MTKNNILPMIFVAFGQKRSEDYGKNDFTFRAESAIIRSEQAPVAQWIEHQIPVLRVGGSSPFWRTKKEVILSGWPLFWYISWDSKGRRQRSCRKKESGGLFFSPWESPFPFRRIPLGMWMKGKPPCGTALPVRWTFAKRRLDGVYRKPCQRFGLGVPPGALSCPAKKLRKNAA